MAALTDGYERQAEVLRVLGHPVRLRILDILARQESCVCHLTAALDRPQPYISQQLAALREIGLVADRREGTMVYYRLTDERFDPVLDRLKTLLQDLGPEALLFPPLPEMPLAGCPCPRCEG